MKKAFLLFTFICLCLSTGCYDFQQNMITNSGIISKQKVNFTNFSQIGINTGFELLLNQNGIESISIL